MKNTGIVRETDELGRVVIPKEIRNSLKIGIKTPIDISISGNKIILEKVREKCIFCNSKKKYIVYKGEVICKKCLEEIKKM